MYEFDTTRGAGTSRRTRPRSIPRLRARAHRPSGGAQPRDDLVSSGSSQARGRRRARLSDARDRLDRRRAPERRARGDRQHARERRARAAAPPRASGTRLVRTRSVAPAQAIEELLRCGPPAAAVRALGARGRRRDRRRPRSRAARRSPMLFGAANRDPRVFDWPETVRRRPPECRRAHLVRRRHPRLHRGTARAHRARSEPPSARGPLPCPWSSSPSRRSALPPSSSGASSAWM